MTAVADPKSLVREFPLDVEAIEAAARRQLDAWHGRGGYCPIFLSGHLTDAQKERLPAPVDLYEEYHSHEKTLTNGLRGALAVPAAGGDGTPCIRPNLGTGVCATAFGAVQTVFRDKMPWITEHVALEDLDDFDAETAPLGEDLECALDRSRYLAEMLDGSGITPFCFDTQSPFDLAHLVMGDEIFYAFYDEPERVHHLLDQCTRLIIRVTREYKQITGEPMDGGRHSGSLTMRGGVRACEDTSTLLNAEQIAEFVTPYTNRLLEAFGGGWVHYCGDNDHLYKAVMDEMPLCYGLNFGNPERHDPAAVIGDCIERGMIYFGHWPRESDESLEAYFTRHLGYRQDAGRGLIMSLWGQPEDPAEAVALWRRLQKAE